MTSEKRKDLFKRKRNQEVSNLVEHVFPAEISRRDALTFFSGFDKNASRKVLGALIHVFKGRKT